MLTATRSLRLKASAKGRIPVPLLLAIALLVAAGLTARGNDTPELVVLRAGESRVIAVPEVSRVAVGQPSIADVRVLSPGEVLINGKSEGQTTLLLWPPSGKAVELAVRVLCSYPVLSEDDLRDLLAEDEVTVRSVAGYLVVEGTPTPGGRDRLQKLAALLGPRLLNLADSPEVNGEDSAQTPSLGAVDADKPAWVYSIKARIIEVDRQACRELGVQWPGDIEIGERASPSGTPVASWSRLQPLLLKLKALEEAGKARILAEPSMVVADGTEGSFLAGGQIPVPLVVDGQAAVEWKDYGVRLRVRPERQRTGKIRVAVRPEVSTLDWVNAVQFGGGTVPALRSRWAETAVEQDSGDTLVLAGLSLSEENEHSGAVPALSEVPLLGFLFRAGRSARRQTELTILLTTTLVLSPDSSEAAGVSE